jgi:DNA-directed RNA polymerase I, II, and III subunit RPABC5
MLVPVRCFNCGTVLGSKWERYTALLNEGKTTAQALELLRITKMCCRMNMLGTVDLMDTLLSYAEDTPVVPVQPAAVPIVTVTTTDDYDSDIESLASVGSEKNGDTSSESESDND